MSQDQFETKNFRVVTEFEGGQTAYGYEGLCVRVAQAGGQTRLTLIGATDKGKPTKEVALAEHCVEVDAKGNKNPGPCLTSGARALKRR